MLETPATPAPANREGLILHRHERLLRALEDSAFDALVLNPGPGMRYLTGLNFHLMERPTVLAFKIGHPPAIVLPEFEMSRLQALDFEIDPFPYTEDPATWGNAFKQMAHSRDLSASRIGVEPRSLRFLELEFLRDAAPEAQFISAESTLAFLRARKDRVEIETMRAAVAAAQQALQATLPMIKPGITERDLSAELTVQLLKAGSEPEFPFAPIIAFGPNSASPHAVPTDRKLRECEPVLVDWGANVGSYFSDLTRVFSYGPPSEEIARIAEICEEANRAAREVARPGIPASDVDRAARAVIEQAGYGEYFTHRTGHGLGLEGHEEPYIRSDNEQILESGMTFTIEPGIYLPGVGGVRIEDDMVITDDGAESLSTLPRNLVVL